MKKSSIISIIILLAGGTLGGYYFSHAPSKVKTVAKNNIPNVDVSKSQVEDINKPTREMQMKAIEMFTTSQKLSEAGDLKALVAYVEETNDPGELDDFKNMTGSSISEFKKGLAKASPEELKLLNDDMKNNAKFMSFVTKDFFTNFRLGTNFWHMVKNVNGSIDVIYENEEVLSEIKDGINRPPLAVCYFGSVMQKDGTWRALPIAAFRCE